MQSGRIVDDLVSLFDFGPTILELAGLQKPKWMEARSLLPYLTVYAIVRSIGSSERFWIFFSVVNTLLLSILLLLVNMKRPLLLFYISIVLTVIDFMIGTYSASVGIGLLGGIYAYAVLIPAIAVTVRRLHDSDRSGWWWPRS